MLPVVTIDFETFPIAQRPDFPPTPVGVAIRRPDNWGLDTQTIYFRWGHPTGNNCSEWEGVKQLAYWFEEAEAGRVWLLFHNSKFDVAVACEGLGLPMPRWDVIHDTMFLLFLDDPHSRTLELKPASEALLGWAPEEKDAVGDYVWEHRKELRAAYPDHDGISRAKGKVSNIWKWFAYVPGDVLEPYAIGDVERTHALFQLLYPRIVERGMLEAYNRERQLMPILLENERVGMRVDVPALQADCENYGAVFGMVEDAIREYLGVPDLNLDADEDVAAALVAADAVDPDAWTKTKSGQLSMSKDNLKPKHFRDPQLASALGYRNRLATCLKMFMQPWLEQALKNNGYITTNWNQTRGGQGGTRTGRPSTNEHNFLNLSKNFEGRTDGYEHPAFLGVPPLPLVRTYVLPDEGHVFLHRDFSGQELRVFAHFECGPLHDAYLADPKTDPHKLVGDEMSRLMGIEFERTKVKILNFQSLYGGGIPAISAKLECSQSEAKEFQGFHNDALPGRKALADALKDVTEGGDPIVTWGGREYFVEPASYSERFKRWMTYFYKLLNYIVQGSAADITKQAIIDWYNHPARDPRCRFMVTVYDEINLSCPTEIWKEQMAVLKEAMERPRLTVPMLSDAKVGPSWGLVEKYAG